MNTVDRHKQRTTTANSGLAKGGLTCFDDTLVLKIPPFAKPQTVSGHAKDDPQPKDTMTKSEKLN